ncbi:histidine kinase DhkG [Pelomyxa schiedti]|nr:histidine kinase DhkG [Pelomyxa schiedti]
MITSFLESTKIHVLIVPAGNIPENKFNEFTAVVSGFNTVDLRDVTRGGAWSNGFVKYSYKTHKTDPSEWENIQIHRKTMAIIGIINCPTTPSIQDTYANFEAMCQIQYPNVSQRMCMAFDPLPSQNDEPSGVLVMIPNCPDTSHLLNYVETLLNDFTAKLVGWLESEVNAARNPQKLVHLSTPLDTSKTADDTKVLQKRKSGRLQKIVGDYCLLGGQQKEAAAAYTAAIEACKATNDLEWSASAQEGWCAACISLNESNLPTCEEDVVNAAQQARENYNKRGAHHLELELVMKMAHFQTLLGHKDRATELLTDAYTYGETHCGTQDRIQLTGTIALLYKFMGFHRKYAFYLWLASGLYRKLFDTSAQHYLLSMCSKYYYINMDKQSSDIVLRTELHRCGTKGWPPLQKHILTDLLSASTNTNNTTNIIKYSTHLLRSLHPRLLSSDQGKLASSLATASARLYRPIDVRGKMLGLPSFVRVTPVKCSSPDSAPVELPRQNAGGAKWIFTPLQQRNKAQAPPYTWVVGETNEVHIEMSNPVSIEVHVESITLCTSGVPAEFYSSQSFTIPRESPIFEVSILGKALSPGILTINGCVIQSCGIMYFHPVKNNGEAVALDEFYYPPSPAKPSQAMTLSNSILVTEPLPSLVCEHCEGSNVRLELTEGEIYDHHFDLINLGSCPVGNVEITCSGDSEVTTSASSSRPVCTLLGGSTSQSNGEPVTSQNVPSTESVTSSQSSSSNARNSFQSPLAITEHLPLLPGDHLPLCIRIEAAKTLSLVTFSAKYWSSAESRYGRLLTVPIHVQVTSGIGVSSITAIPQGDNCLLVISLHNATLKAATVACSFSSDNRTVICTGDALIPKQMSASVVLQIPRILQGPDMQLPEEYMPQLTAATVSGTGNSGSLPNPTGHSSMVKLLDWCKSYIMQHLTVTWKLIGSCTGQTNLGGITITPKTARALTQAPVKLGMSICLIPNYSQELVSVNSNSMIPQGDLLLDTFQPLYRVKKFEQFQVTLVVTNNRPPECSPLSQIVLQLLPENSHTSPRMDQFLWVTGLLSCELKELAPGMTAKHTVVVSFVETGRFTLTGLCTRHPNANQCFGEHSVCFDVS